MLRLLFSRSALLPALGIALMVGGAFLPEGNGASMVVILIGANLAFFSLRYFSRNFAWGADSRPMLALCGLLFLLGVGIMLSLPMFEKFNIMMALLCTGLYLCIYTIWTVPRLVSTPFRILAVVGAILMGVGGIFGYLGLREWWLFAESEPTAQEISLKDLLEHGHGSNRYVKIQDFRFCDRHAIEKREGKASFKILWVPIVPVDHQAVKREGPPPSVPPRLSAVACYVYSTESPGGNPRFAAAEPPDAQLRWKELDAQLLWKEADGYECTVANGIANLKPEVQERLGRLAPQTDLTEILILDRRKPRSADFVQDSVVGGGAGFITGWLCLAIVYWRAWKVVATYHKGPPASSLPSWA